MSSTHLPSPLKNTWQDNKAFVLLILSQLLILSVLKIIFYYYNYPFIFSRSDTENSMFGLLQLIKWSVYFDLLVLLLVNIPLLFLLQLSRLVSGQLAPVLIIFLFVTLNSLVVLLNCADIFYFRFHYQRANADLLYVLKNPFSQFLHLDPRMIITILLFIFFTVFITRLLFKGFLRAFHSGGRAGLVTLLSILAIIALPFYRARLERALVPNYPLTEISSKQLLVVQNSFHTFLYSVFRGSQEPFRNDYMPIPECDSLLPTRKYLAPSRDTHPNIVLFIMESVPYDFFDPNSPYKVDMPFFDSLIKKSTFYNNAFCFAHQSNKGITAILAALPTLQDIPLYHSSYINMAFTHIGSALRQHQYHSFFCIGDDYDNFGFAKCVRWMGIDDYYCRDDIPGSSKLPAHTMGIHDEYVFDFMLGKVNGISKPFFATNYNISTHYPYDLPPSFNKKFPSGYTSPMKSMSYYDQSLHHFFNEAQKENWFRNTVFIFCSDHWLVPDDNKTNFNAVSGYRIPIIIYDAAAGEGKTISRHVSQFDVMGTILSLSGYPDSIISFGGSLMDTANNNPVSFSRANSNLYQVSDSAYILGFNPSRNSPEFLFHYTLDPDLQNNVLAADSVATVRRDLTKKMQAFLQKACIQYNGEKFY